MALGEMPDLRDQPWWTEADQAELNMGLWELVCALDVVDHPETRGKMIDLVLDWRERRMLLSRADYYRRMHVERALSPHKETEQSALHSSRLHSYASSPLPRPTHGHPQGPAC